MTFEYRRAHVTAFWAVGSGVLASAAGFAAAASGTPNPWAWALAIPGALLLPGIVQNRWFEWGVRAWNGASWRLDAALRQYVLAVTYFVLFATLAPSRRSRNLAGRGRHGSKWIRRGPGTPGFDADSIDSGTAAGCLRALTTYSQLPGKRWSLCLAPVAFLLTLLRDDHEESAIHGSTYTLY